MAIFTGCGTHKYGCGFGANTRKIYSKHDSALIIERNVNGKILTTYKLLSYRPNLTNCRGYGKVVKIDNKTLLIRMTGVLLRNDSVITPVKFLIIPEGKFFKELTPYCNSDIYVYFESDFVVVDYSSDFQFTSNGCVDHVDYIRNSKRNDVIYCEISNKF